MAQYIFSQNRLADFNDRKPEAVTRMFMQFYPMVVSQAKRMADVTQNPEDLAQEVFIKILSRKTDFQRIDQLVLYLYKVTETTCEKDLRKETNRRGKMQEIGQVFVDHQVRDMEKEKTRAAYESLKYIAIQILPPQCRQIFILHYVEELKIREIANFLNISEKTVANHINQGNRHLKMEVEKRGGREQIYTALLLWILQAEFLFQNNFYENI